MSTTAVPSSVIQEPAEKYHAKAKEYLSSHALSDFRRCPLLYHKKKLGLVEDEDRPAYLLGRALHTLALEGRDRFEAEYVVGGPINPKTGELFGSNTKDYDACCTPLDRWRTTGEKRRRSLYFRPWLLAGALAPGGSYRHSFLSL
jgi:hypothetical protein